MKIIGILFLVSASLLLAQAPRKEPLTKYRQLWEKSLVTEEPVEDKGPVEEPPNELDDYVLGGWTQTSQGYLVSLINTKDPKKRRTIAPGMPNSEGFLVMDVKRDPMNYKSSQVLIQMGPHQKWIGYEDKFLTLQQPAASQQNNAAQNAARQRAAQQRQQQAKPPMPNANNTNQKKPAQRAPRVRRVPVPPNK